MKTAAAGFAPPPTAVETATVTTQAVTDLFEAVGTLEAGESVTVVSEIDGVITRLPFREGGNVRRGALIAKLDDSQLAAERERAAALLAQSQSSYDRIKEVVDLGAGAPQDLDDASAALKVAQSNLALADTRLAKDTCGRTVFRIHWSQTSEPRYVFARRTVYHGSCSDQQTAR